MSCPKYCSKCAKKDEWVEMEVTDRVEVGRGYDIEYTCPKCGHWQTVYEF
jgi:ribosomal protein S27E